MPSAFSPMREKSYILVLRPASTSLIAHTVVAILLNMRVKGDAI